MKTRSRVFLLTLLSIVVLWPNRKLTATSYYTPPACEAFNLAKAVFIGRVVNASQKREYVYDDEADEPSGEADEPSVACSLELVFEVIESFSGTQGRFMTVWESGGETCEGLDSTPGEVYLVYAYGGEGEKLWAGARTRSLKQDSINASDGQWKQEYLRKMQKENDDELEFLRSVSRKTLGGARIFGFAHSSGRILSNNDKGYRDSLAGVTIKIENERQSLEVKTDSDGKYDVQGLEPGIYRVTAVAPEGYVPFRSVRWGDYSKSWDKGLPLRDCGCAQLVFELSPSAKVDGRVLDAEGRPLSGVEVSLISEKWREEEEIKDGDIGLLQTRYSETDAGGRYKIEKVAPGRYLLGVNVIRPTSQSPYPRIFYPGVSDIKQAEVITVEPGKLAGPFDLSLTQKLEKHKIRGSVVWPDDTPVVGAQIELLNPDERLRRGYEATTDERGRFTIEGLKDYEYKVRVYWRDNESSASEEDNLKFTGDVKDLKIVLSKQ
jgi:carboxypeptidase family protein/prealbumin domain-containing protein